MSYQNYQVKIGTVGKPHGLKGAFFISGRKDPLPNDLAMVALQAADGRVLRANILASRKQSDRWVLQLDSIASREDLTPWQGSKILCAVQDIPISQEEYLWADLLGRVVEDSSGVEIGSVLRVENFGATDILVLSGEKGAELSIPFVDSYFEMDFARDRSPLRLKVSQVIFAESWQFHGN